VLPSLRRKFLFRRTEEGLEVRPRANLGQNSGCESGLSGC
jgi:hypothetical protein